MSRTIKLVSMFNVYINFTVFTAKVGLCSIYAKCFVTQKSYLNTSVSFHTMRSVNTVRNTFKKSSLSILFRLPRFPLLRFPPCSLVPRFPLPHFPPLQSGAAISTPAVWCRVFHSRVCTPAVWCRVFHSRVFSVSTTVGLCSLR